VGQVGSCGAWPKLPRDENAPDAQRVLFPTLTITKGERPPKREEVGSAPVW